MLFAETLFGGNAREGRNIFSFNSTAQCTRCHAVRGEGGTVGSVTHDHRQPIDQRANFASTHRAKCTHCARIR